MSSKVFVKPDGYLYREGDVMYRHQLADTLDIVASDDGVYNMYNGSLAQRILQDLHDIGCWHCLPSELRCIAVGSTFRRRLKAELFS